MYNQLNLLLSVKSKSLIYKKIIIPRWVYLAQFREFSQPIKNYYRYPKLLHLKTHSPAYSGKELS